MSKPIRILSHATILGFILGVSMIVVPLSQNIMPESAMMLLLGSTLIVVARYFRRYNMKM